MTSLYELTDELAAAQRDLAEMVGNEVISDQECDDTLAAMLDQHQVKTVGVIAYIKNLKAEVGAFEGEMIRLQKRHSSLSKQVKFYEGYLLTQMLKLDQTTAGEGVHTAKIKQGSMRCEITNADDLSPAFYHYENTKVIDKRAITRSIKAGATVTGAEMVRGESTIKLA